MDNREYIDREIAARAKDELDARAILDLAAEEKRSTTAEEDERFDRFVASSEVRKARINKLVALDTDSTALAEQVRARIGDQSDSGSGSPDGGDGRTWDARIAETVRSFIEAKQRGGNVPSEIGLDVPFNAGDEVRAISDFANNTSLYVSDFSTRVAVYARTMSPWLGQGTIIDANNGRPLVLPTLTADVTSYTPGEGTAITESSGTLATATATPVSYKALSYISMEADEDETIGLMPLLSMSQGRSLGLAFGTAATAVILAGAGNGGTATGLTGTGTATFIGYEDLLDLKYGVAAPYRLVGAWVFSNGLIVKARKWKDADGQYYWQPSVAQGQPDLFDGQPVYEDPALATPASATKSAVYGDLSTFVVKRMPLRVAVSTEYRFNTDEVALKSVLRIGGAVSLSAALKYIVSAAS
jgi:HK97 family phage major capsid protein